MSKSDHIEIDLAVVVKTVVKQKVIFLSMVMISVLIAVVASFTVTKKYRSEITLSLNSSSFNNSGAKKLSGIASLVGIGGVSQSDDSTIFIAKLKSRFMKREFIESHSLLPLLYKDIWDEAQKTWRNDTVPKMWDAVRLFDKEVLNIRTDKETGLLNLSIEWNDAEIAKQWADAYVVLVNRTLKKEFDDEVDKNLEFLKEQLASTTNSSVRNSLNSLIEEELKKAMLSNGSAEFAFKTLDPAVIPSRPYSPRKVIFVLVGLILGMILGTGLAMYIDKRDTQ
tara:strand:+ start:1765 stop:2607 length:843 start_codon:yes stop_codon:yes gene_type:complete